MTDGLLIQLLGYFCIAAATYAAIKSDLTRAILTAEQAQKAADECHVRLDKHIDQQ